MAKGRGPLGRVATAALGVGVWTLTEYVAHRWVMHGRRTWGVVGREHRAHHTDPEATDPRLRALGYVGVLTPVLAGSSLVGVWPLGVGWAAGYAAYEQFHWHEHHRPPVRSWERAARRRHFAHHFGSPRANFGVTTPLWDHVFGTFRPVTAVRVPVHQAMPWLLDDDAGGAVRARFANDYVLVGTRPGSSRAASAGAYDRGS